MEIALADQHIFVLDDRLTPDDIRQRAMDRRTGAFGGGLGSLLQRPKADDIELVNSQRQLEPFWHVGGRALYVYDRARDYTVPASGAGGPRGHGPRRAPSDHGRRWPRRRFLSLPGRCLAVFPSASCAPAAAAAGPRGGRGGHSRGAAGVAPPAAAGGRTTPPSGRPPPPPPPPGAGSRGGPGRFPAGGRPGVEEAGGLGPLPPSFGGRWASLVPQGPTGRGRGGGARRDKRWYGAGGGGPTGGHLRRPVRYRSRHRGAARSWRQHRHQGREADNGPKPEVLSRARESPRPELSSPSGCRRRRLPACPRARRSRGCGARARPPPRSPRKSPRTAWPS